MEDGVHNCLGLRLASAYRRVDRLFNRGYSSLGLNHAGAQVLLCLFQNGEMRLMDLGTRLGLDSSTMSRLGKELNRRRLVRRRTDPKDGRGVLLRPARRALDLRVEIVDRQRRANQRLRREVAEEDLTSFLRVLEAMDKLP